MECFRCGGTRIEFRKTIMQNGQTSIGAYCLQCNRLATKETCIPKRRFTDGQIANMAIEHDYSQHDNVCCVKGCNRHDVEWHHFAPRYLFGDAADNWPVGPLCVLHHRMWHAALKGLLMRRCPKCGQTADATALVAAFNDPPGWSFWGEAGARWIVCQSPEFVHFRVTIGGRTYHRLATIVPEVTTPAPRPQPVPRRGAALPLRDMAAQEDWL